MSYPSRVEWLRIDALQPYGTLRWYVAQIRLVKQMAREAEALNMHSLAAHWQNDVTFFEYQLDVFCALKNKDPID